MAAFDPFLPPLRNGACVAWRQKWLALVGYLVERTFAGT
jgi:hypothetical protein